MNYKESEFNIIYIKFLKCRNNFARIFLLNALTVFDSFYFRIN